MANQATKTAAHRRKERQAQAARDDILEAAANAFARLGYQAATMQQIAEEAGFTAASLYTYFDSKLAIYEELRTTVIREAFGALDDSTPTETDFEGQLLAMARSTLSIADRRRSAFVLFMNIATGAEPDPRKKEKETRPKEAYLQTIVEWFDKHAGAELGSVDSGTAALLFWGITQAFFQRWLRYHSGEPLASHAEEIVGFFLNGVRGSSS